MSSETSEAFYSYGFSRFFVMCLIWPSKLASCFESWSMAVVVVQSVSSWRAKDISDSSSSFSQTFLSIPFMRELKSGPWTLGVSIHFLMLVSVRPAASLTSLYITLAKGVRSHFLLLVHITGASEHCPILVNPSWLLGMGRTD